MSRNRPLSKWYVVAPRSQHETFTNSELKMQAGMESCLTKSIMAGGMGFALGGAFGLFMSSVGRYWSFRTVPHGLRAIDRYRADIGCTSRCLTIRLSLLKDKHCPIFRFENSSAAVSKIWARGPTRPPRISRSLGPSTLELSAVLKAFGQDQIYRIRLQLVV